MDTSVSFNKFMSLAEQDGRIFYSMLQAAKSMAGWWLRAILLVFLFPLLLIFAQISPYIFRSPLNKIFPLLPYIKDKNSLNWLKDTFLLYYYTLKGYKPFCLFRKPVNSLMDELDEQIDSLSFSLKNQDFLQHAIENIEHYK